MAAPDPNGPDRTRPADVGRSEPLFRWDTLTEVGTQELRYQDRTVPGRILEVEMTGGEKVRLWRADDSREYFCHGLTFDGKGAPGGAASPLGDHVPTILRAHYQAVSETQARAGDIVVWRGARADEVTHSAVLMDPLLTPDGDSLDYTARLQTKNGILPEATMSLGQLIENYYGESYQVYRRR
jgi:hypothetical protein